MNVAVAELLPLPLPLPVLPLPLLLLFVAMLDGAVPPPHETSPMASTRVRDIIANPRSRIAALSLSRRPIKTTAIAKRHRAVPVTLHQTGFLLPGKPRTDGG